MKKNAFIAAAILVVVVLAVLIARPDYDYEKALKKIEKLTSFEMTVSTIVTIKTNDSERQSAIDQTVRVQNLGQEDLRYTVSSQSTTQNFTENSLNVTENEYTYSDGKYYFSLPGLKYKSATEKEAAEQNIVHLINNITFPYEKMYNISPEMEGKSCVYYYAVEKEDVSDYVDALLQTAINQSGGSVFSCDGVYASATVKGGYVTERSLCIDYVSEEGIVINLEIYTSLTEKTATVPKPDESKYMTM